MNVRLLGLVMAFGLSIPVAQAQMLQPGLNCPPKVGQIN
jgi:hypothetical protein